MNYFLFAAALLILIDLVDLCSAAPQRICAAPEVIKKAQKNTTGSLRWCFRFALRRRLSLCGAGRDASFRSAFQSVSGCGVL